MLARSITAGSVFRSTVRCLPYRPLAATSQTDVASLLVPGITLLSYFAYGLQDYAGTRFPDAWSYPGALLNSTATAFVDEVAFRGVLLGLLLLAGVNPTLANFTQAIVYTLTTRLGAPGRDRYLLLMTLGMGLLGGWLTVATGGIAAAFLGHAITRFALFLCTGHTGQTKPRGREVEEIEKRRRPPEGWRVIGSRESPSRDR